MLETLFVLVSDIRVSLFFVGEMRALYLGILFCITTLGLKSQNAQEPVDFDKLNTSFLEHLTKMKIDELRRQKRLKPLRNDSILFLAAQNHSAYMSAHNKLSHFQKDNKALEDPQLRIEFYGAVNVFAGENVLYFPTGASVNVKYQKEPIAPKTYEEYAQALAQGWKHSKPHYSNIISKDYIITGLSITYDAKSEQLWATQVFGQVLGAYQFTDHSGIFPFSGSQKKKMIPEK